MGELANRRSQTEARIQQLCAKLKPSEKIARNKACVYATGSFGRCEASQHSDLDLFILGKSKTVKGKRGEKESRLKQLEDIRIKANLIDVTSELGIPEFSGDGRYLIHYAIHELTQTLGKPEDDVTNTFTARLLLLLESRPLVGAKVYDEVIDNVIDAYWRDYADHKQNFVPAYLANDILRLWRTFCVNYEAGTQREPEDRKAKGKLKNFKLKHSRLLTCYSALLYLLATYRLHQTVTPEHAKQMIRLTPTERLEWLKTERPLVKSKPTVSRLLEHYEDFLEATNSPERDLVERFRDPAKSKASMAKATKFGDLVFEAMMAVAGNGNRFYRLIVV